jgi:hypothetical protein
VTKLPEFIYNSIGEIITFLIIGLVYGGKKLYCYFYDLVKKSRASDLESKIKLHTDPIMKATQENSKGISELKSYIKTSFSDDGVVGKRLKHTHHDIKDISAKEEGVLTVLMDQLLDNSKKMDALNEKIDNNKK